MVFITELYVSRKGLDIIFLCLGLNVGGKMVALRVELENHPGDGPQCVCSYNCAGRVIWTQCSGA